MRVVVRRTGLNASVLRAWERRYGAVEPDRSDGGQRLYSEADIRKLTLLKKLVDLGFPIGQVAESEEDALRELLLRSRPAATDSAVQEGDDSGLPSAGAGPAAPVSESAPPPAAQPVASAEAAVGRASSVPTGKFAPHQCANLERFFHVGMEAVQEMDTRKLDDLLHRASLTLTSRELTDGLMVPLLAKIGLLWEKGEVGPASEHIASGVVRRFLDGLLERLAGRSAGPILLTGTPAGQRHEFGALLAGVVAATEGWAVVPLGADLPASEIAEAARRKEAQVVALSALHPERDTRVRDELLALKARLAGATQILVGGPGAAPFREELGAAGILYLRDMDGLRSRLRAIWS